MTSWTCEGCGLQHECDEPLSAGHIGYRLAWTDSPRDGRARLVERVGTVEGVFAGRWRNAPDERLAIRCDDGVLRFIDDWRFLQRLGSLRVLAQREAEVKHD